MTKELVEIKNLLAIPPEKRLKTILNAKDPAALVQAMPEEEAWLTIKKTGDNDALPILALTSKDQLQYIIDIELWKRDNFKEDESLHWLNLIKECGSKKVMQWVHETDPETVILVFKKFVTVQKKENQEDNPLEREWPGELPPSTVDGVYFFQALTQKADDVIRPIMETIAKSDHEFFMRLCEEIISELTCNVEETAFSWRTKRLADKGFCSIEESLEVYKYLNDRQIASLPKRNELNLEDLRKPAFVPLALGGESYPILMLALAELKNDPISEEIVIEMLRLANKVLIADGRPITPETIDASLKKVMGYVNIGLERLSGSDSHKAGVVLKERWTTHLFQIGFSEISKLRQLARKFMTSGWPSKTEEDISLLDEPAASRITNVLRKKPLYYSTDSMENPLREFRSIDEIREIERSIERAEYLGRLFMDVFKISPAELKSLTIDRENMTFTNALLTIWAKGSVSGQYKFAPLTEKEFNSVLKKAKPDSGAKFFEWIIKHQPNVNSQEEKHLKSIVEDCFNKFNDEFGELSGKHPSDWRFVQSIWVIPSAD